MCKYQVELKSKEGHQIKTLKDWLDYAPPAKKEEHWQDGRSAKELARYIVGEKGCLPKELEYVLTKLECKEGTKLIGIPELVTKLDSRGRGRTHDLLLVKENEIVVGIEAKVDETFDKQVYEIIEELVGKNGEEAQGKYKRLKGLYESIYDSKIDKTYLRYQLLAATVGTLIEAKNAKASKAALVIITFVDTLSGVSKQMIRNEEDLNYFISTIYKYKKGGKYYNLPGFKDIEFYVENIKVVI